MFSNKSFLKTFIYSFILMKLMFIGKLVTQIIQKINSYTETDDNIYRYKPLLGLYDKIMLSSSVNGKNYQAVLEKMFANIEYILKKVLEGIVLIDVSNNFEQFLLW